MAKALSNKKLCGKCGKRTPHLVAKHQGKIIEACGSCGAETVRKA